MADIAQLPHVLAALNGASVLLLGAGFVCIRRRRRRAHRACMLSAVVVGTAFLALYLVYHAAGGETPFAGQGAVRPLYFTILIGHIVLATAVVPLILATLVPALRERFEGHRRWARWTLPVWLYVGASGVAVYVMRVHLYPHAGG